MKQLAALMSYEYEDEAEQAKNKEKQAAAILDFVMKLILNAGDAEKELAELIDSLVGDDTFDNPDIIDVLHAAVLEFIEYKNSKKEAIDFFKSALTQQMQK